MTRDASANPSSIAGVAANSPRPIDDSLNASAQSVIYDVCQIAGGANLIVPNCDKLLLFLRNLMLNPYYEFHFMPHALWHFVWYKV